MSVFHQKIEKKMSEFFTIAELCRSDSARKHNIDNTPTDDVRERLEMLITRLLDPVRRRWGFPIRVTSGFRSPELNRKVGGAAGSQHQRGEAADITAGDSEKNKMLFGMIIEMQRAGEIVFDQLIDEKGYRWLHISFSSNNRNQVLHL